MSRFIFLKEEYVIYRRSCHVWDPFVSLFYKTSLRDRSSISSSSVGLLVHRSGLYKKRPKGLRVARDF
jgi:hypothetical protein